MYESNRHWSRVSIFVYTLRQTFWAILVFDIQRVQWDIPEKMLVVSLKLPLVICWYFAYLIVSIGVLGGTDGKTSDVVLLNHGVYDSSTITAVMRCAHHCLKNVPGCVAITYDSSNNICQLREYSNSSISKKICVAYI